MALSDCERCWETPCVCRDAHGYRHLSIKELLYIRDGLNALIKKKQGTGQDPNKREH